MRWHGSAHGFFAADKSRPIFGHTAAGFSYMCHGRSVMGRRGLCWRSRDFRLGDFRLYRRVHKETQGGLGASAHVVAPYEDPNPRFDDLLLYHADVQRGHVGVRGDGESESEEFPSRGSHRVGASRMIDLRSVR